MSTRTRRPPRRRRARAWWIVLLVIIVVGGIAYAVHRSRQRAAPPPPPTPINVTFPEGLRREQIAPLVGGGGGGRETMARAGGKDPARLPAALDAARALFGTSGA